MRIRLVTAWAAAWLALLVWMTAPLAAQAGLPNGKQFNLSVTNGAVVHFTVPAGTSYCVYSFNTNPVNYDVGTTSANAAPTAGTPGTGMPLNAGGYASFASYASCVNFGVIAQAGTAFGNALYFR